jgi:hypothetical protein
MANLKLLNPSSGNKQNLKDYLILYNNLPQNREHLVIAWSNLYLKMLFAMAKANPAIELATLTREQIYDDNLPCKTLIEAIQAGLLIEARRYKIDNLRN